MSLTGESGNPIEIARGYIDPANVSPLCRREGDIGLLGFDPVSQDVVVPRGIECNTEFPVRR